MNSENSEQFSKCIRGIVLNSIKSEHDKQNFPTSVVRTFKILFGKAEIVYDVLIIQIMSIYLGRLIVEITC